MLQSPPGIASEELKKAMSSYASRPGPWTTSSIQMLRCALTSIFHNLPEKTQSQIEYLVLDGSHFLSLLDPLNKEFGDRVMFLHVQSDARKSAECLFKQALGIQSAMLTPILTKPTTIPTQSKHVKPSPSPSPSSLTKSILTHLSTTCEEFLSQQRKLDQGVEFARISDLDLSLTEGEEDIMKLVKRVYRAVGVDLKEEVVKKINADGGLEKLELELEDCRNFDISNPAFSMPNFQDLFDENIKTYMKV
ncbi:hypothetical protein HDU76_013788 [Blyttiomyces sp. JEL0837]|nr:hypothetical protein HDU76_013788 [Blyttiomyces sp. JEL0837]